MRQGVDRLDRLSHKRAETMDCGDLAMTLNIGLIARLAFALVILAPAALWGTLALWFRAPGPDAARPLFAAFFAIFALGCLIKLFRAPRWRAGAVFVLGFALLLGWWSTLVPPRDADWAPDVSRQVTGEVKGDILTLTNMRDFDWVTPTQFHENWKTESFDLSKLNALDVFLAYWAGPEMTHPIISFGFSDGRFLAWSIEVRSRRGGEFSPLADLFKANPLVIIASDERDSVRLRANIRKEDVQLYRLNLSPELTRKILLQFVADSNALAEQPRFFNSLSSNCTTSALRLVRAAGGVQPFDWRLIVNGFLPSLFYERGLVDTSISYDELRARSHIGDQARAADQAPDFSNLIRVNVPTPKRN